MPSIQVVVAGTVLVLSCISYWYYRLKKPKDINAVPKKWRRVGYLRKVNLYLLTPCPPLDVDDDAEFSCDILGLRLDHLRNKSLVIFDGLYNTISPSSCPKVGLINTRNMGEGIIRLSAPGMPDMEINLAEIPEKGALMSTSVFTSNVKAVLCGLKYDQWLSTFLVQDISGIHLVYFYREGTPDEINESFVKECPAEEVILNDNEGYVLMNMSSIAFVNKHLAIPMNPFVFQSNFYVRLDYLEPFAEDLWRWIKIGDETIFKVAGPCLFDRNIDSISKEPNPIQLPSNVLKRSTRRYGWGVHREPVMGIQLKVHTLGKVKLNDVIYVGK